MGLYWLPNLVILKGEEDWKNKQGILVTHTQPVFIEGGERQKEQARNTTC